MQAAHKKILEFIQQPNRKFLIPIYQRNYDWQVLQCKTLLDDIIFTQKTAEKNEKTIHFIGSIVAISCSAYKETDNDNKELTIIDGQQRLTTILYVALYRFAKSKNSKAENDKNEQDKKIAKEKNVIYNQILTNQFDFTISSKFCLAKICC